MNKVCFIISHFYNRNYTSYIKYYIDNIQYFYNDSLIIIVDNNSKYIADINILFNPYLKQPFYKFLILVFYKIFNTIYGNIHMYCCKQRF